MDEKVNYSIESTVTLYGILCETIDIMQKESSKEKATKTSIYDYINNYLIYSAPFLLLQDEFGDKEQLAHDCYVLTKDIIENSTVSPVHKNKLYEPLRQSKIYMFSSKIYKTGHLTAYSNLLNFSLSIIDDLNEDNQATIELKDVCRPLVIFLVTGFPLKTNKKNNMDENIKTLSDYITFQIGILTDIYFNIRLARENILQKTPMDYIKSLNKIVISFFTNHNYSEEALEYSTNLLTRLYVLTLSGLDKIYNVEEICESLNLKQSKTNNFKIDKLQSVKQVTKAKSKTGDKKDDKSRPKRKKASVTIPRKQSSGRTKSRTEG